MAEKEKKSTAKVPSENDVRVVINLSPSKEDDAPSEGVSKGVSGSKEGTGSKAVSGTDKAPSSAPPSQKDLFQDDNTDEEVYAVAEESVKILEESRRETSEVLKELQSDWDSQNNAEEEAKTVPRNKGKASKPKSGGILVQKKRDNKFFKSRNEKASPVEQDATGTGTRCTFKKPKKVPKVALKRVPTPKGEPKKSTSAPTQTSSVAALNKRNMKGETLLHRECIKGNVEKVSVGNTLGTPPT